MSNQSRRDAINAVLGHQSPAAAFDYKASPSGNVYAENVFTLGKIKEAISKSAYKSLVKTMNGEKQLDVAVANEVASAMKSWAMAKGATHVAHVFYPLTGRMANKHDAFFDPSGEGIISEFAGAMLIQQEPDGSSFPNGGLRGTHEARGYTAWDPTSPAYLLDNANGTTLCIPTAFLSWKGDSMDFKTPLLRAQKAMGEQAARILHAFGHRDIAPITASGGPEQEYFLVDRAFYAARPDLISAGRTLFGAPSPKGQEFDDHYFGIINERVQAFMMEFDRESYKLGIPIKTRHNEVAPGQYEVAPVYQSGNVASDQQQVIMSLLQSIAEKYGFACLLHEKPFAGINGSGKHLNFSIGNATQGNLLDPTDTPHENLQFLTFVAAIVRGVYKHAPLLRANVASASNDHRLGANEAPPAIMSVFLGAQLADVMAQIKSGDLSSSIEVGTIDLGVGSMPVLPRHSGDRNRTSPMAFTGNRFEFRAVGSNQSIAPPFIALNAIMAESFDYVATQLEASDARTKAGKQEAALAVIKGILEECGNVLFEGDGYSDEWHKEAEHERGLPNLRTSADALPYSADDAAVALYDSYNIMSPQETHARMEVALEQYNMTVNVESNLVVEMAKTMIYPAAARYQAELAGAAASLKAAGVKGDTSVLQTLTDEMGALNKAVAKLEKAKAKHIDDPVKEARHCADSVLPAMLEVREAADSLEGLVADDLWPLPTYQEMLFLR